MKLLLGSRNKGKHREITQSLADLPLEIILPDALGITEDPEEHGTTYAENAELKARFYYAASHHLPTIADDSGIVVEALHGELGVQTRRWGAGKNATDAEWIAYFLERMRREENKNAYFVSTIVFIDDRGVSHLFTGKCEGMITDSLQGESLPGLPLRSCFQPKGCDKTFSEMTFEEEQSVHHRYQAMRQLKEYFITILPAGTITKA